MKKNWALPLQYMEKFVVSARKYRPQTFATVIGQQHITTTLKNAIANNQLAHAFLFCGPRGVGKTTCARILAKTINCTNLQSNGEACNSCSSCNSFDGGASLNIHELDAASNNSVDDIRALTEQVRFAPQAGDYKIYIIDEVHMLTSAAFNAFLKTLEEPPSYAKFILATTEKHKILPTILSRCQIFDFKRITPKDTADHLQDICTQEGVSVTAEALHLIARKSEGCMRDALSILDKITSFTGGALTYENTLEHLNVLDEDAFFNMLDAMHIQNLPAMMTLYDSINAKGFEADVFLNGFAEFLRNLLFAYHADTMNLVDVADVFRKKYLAASASMPIQVVLNALTIIGHAENELKTAKNKKLFVEMTLIKLCYVQQAMQVVANTGNVVARKNIAGPIAYKQVIPWRNNPPTNEAKLTIEQPTQVVANKANVITSTVANTIATGNVNVGALATTGIKSLGKTGLAQIKDELRRTNKTAGNFKEVTLENVQKVWNEIAEILKNQQKLSTAKVLQLATLSYDTQRNHVTILATSEIQFSSISQETLMINERLKDVFGLQKPLWELVIQEPDEQATQNATAAQEKVLSSMEQYKKMIALYPDIKIFREMFRLDLER